MKKLKKAIKTDEKQLFRAALGLHASGVTIVTTHYNKQPVGITIGSFTSLSLQPPLVLFCLDNKSRALPAFKKNTAFAVNILDKKQKKLAQLFASRDKRDWGKTGYVRGQKNVRYFTGCRAVLECSVFSRIKAGDHTIIMGRVRHIMLSEKKSSPLLYVERDYHTAQII